MYLCLNKLASKVWKKNCPNSSIYTVKSSKKVRVNMSLFILCHFSFVSNATNFFIHSLNRFILKKKMLTCCWFSSIRCPICNYHRSEYNRQKSKHGECQWNWGVWECSEITAGLLR